MAHWRSVRTLLFQSTALLCWLNSPFFSPSVLADESVESLRAQGLIVSQDSGGGSAAPSNPYIQRRLLVKTQQPQQSPPAADNVPPPPAIAEQTAISPPERHPASLAAASDSQQEYAVSGQENADNASSKGVLTQIWEGIEAPFKSITDTEPQPEVRRQPVALQAKHVPPAAGGSRKPFAANVAMTADGNPNSTGKYAPSLSPQELAKLVPSAGTPDPDNATPLIPTPPPSAVIAPPTLPAQPVPPSVPVASAPAPALTPLLASPVAAAPDTAPAAPPAPATAVISDPGANTKATTPIKIADPAPPEAPKTPAKSLEVMTPETDAAQESQEASEPVQDLSKQSKKILGKLPSNMDADKKGSGVKKLNIDHAKDASPALKNGVTNPTEETIKHEATGIKIEIRKQQQDYANFADEKAYNALIAGNTDQAIELYKDVLANNPDNKNALFGLATTYHRAGQLELARPLYGRLLAIDPNNRDALNNFLVLVADEAPEAALDELQKLENRNPDFSPIPAQMAIIYEKQGNMDKASEKMFRAIALAPENLTYRYNLAIMMDKQHNYDEAAKLYKQLLEAERRGEVIPGNASKIQERLTFISSNRS